MSALRKVLVVDDDPVVGTSFNRVLSEEKGYVVITAHNAAEALEKLREQAFDLVFTDIKMPGMDGIELAERVKAKRPWTPVVIVTGYGSKVNEHRARTIGVSGFMNKPLSPEMIEESAVNALHEAEASTVPPPLLGPGEQLQAEPVAQTTTLRHVAFGVAAPFIGLAYVALLPFAGLAVLAWMGAKALWEPPVKKAVLNYLRNVAMFIAAPFVGLAYALLLPFVGTAMLVWLGLQAVLTRTAEK
jgi:CheY-like chemotaxis protein